MIGRLLLSLAAVSILAACGGGDNRDDPPDIRYGEEVCAQCGMIISEARYAAAYVTAAGDVRLFDDVGGMLAYDAQNREELSVYWVHDFNTEKWLRADTAVYVLSDKLASPMGWGVAAFANMAGAEQFVAENEGIITTWRELRAGAAAGHLTPDELSAYIQQQ